MPIKGTACGTPWHLGVSKVRCQLNGVFRPSRQFLSKGLNEGPLFSLDLTHVHTSCRLIVTYLLGVTFSLKDSHNNLFKRSNLSLPQDRQTLLLLSLWISSKLKRFYVVQSLNVLFYPNSGKSRFVTVLDFSISFFLKKKSPRRNMVVFIPLVMILFPEVEQWILANI